MDDMLTYAGNIHIHSRYSDGSGDFKQICAAAAEAGLSYVVICDHNTMTGFCEEAIYDGVVLLVGSEINKEHNHYLALAIDDLVDLDDHNPQRVIDQVREKGGLGFIAHPFDRGSRYIEKGKAYPWTHWPVFGFNGIEIWNYSSYWRGLHPSLFRTLYWFFLNRKGAMKGPSRRLLRLWDCYNINGHKTVGIGGSDAHAYSYRFGFFRITIFTYRYTFTAINTYLVLNEKLKQEFVGAKDQIIGALRDGCCYISYDSLCPGGDFSFFASDGDQVVQMGGMTTYRKELKLHVKTPGKRVLIRLIHNSRLIYATESRQLDYKPAEPGVYRVEVYYRSLFGRPRPWIYSNPIYIQPVASSLQ